MGNIEIYKDRWPLLTLIVDGEQTDEDVRRFQETLTDYYNKGEAFLMISYIEKYGTKIGQVQSMARWAKAHREEQKKYVKGNAIVIPSEGFRLLLSTFFLIFTLPFPYLVTSDPDEAEAWIQRRAEEVGMRIPDEIKG